MPCGFFTKFSAKEIWKGVTGVSAAGMRRGRGRGPGRAIVKDFSKGFQLGQGRRQIVLPGLNAPSLNTLKISESGINADYDDKISKARKELSKSRKITTLPLDRGWSGRRSHGRNAGQPDDHNETSFEGFTSTVLMMRPLLGMDGKVGRIRRTHVIVVTGNGNGLAGFGIALGKDPRSIVRRARNRAAQSLVRVPIWDDHTVMHDFFSRYYYTTVFVERKPKGYGIRAQRIIKAICEAFGIKDIQAKIEGSKRNQINITKAFFLGLMNQRNYQDIAEDKRLHLVELKEENFNYPTVLASPKSPVRTHQEITAQNENIDFTYYIYDGKIKQVKAPRKKPFVDHPFYYRYLDKLDYQKNREMTKLLLAAKYGDTKVNDVFPLFKTTAKSFNNPEEGGEII